MEQLGWKKAGAFISSIIISFGRLPEAIITPAAISTYLPPSVRLLSQLLFRAHAPSPSWWGRTDDDNLCSMWRRRWNQSNYGKAHSLRLDPGTDPNWVVSSPLGHPDAGHATTPVLRHWDAMSLCGRDADLAVCQSLVPSTRIGRLSCLYMKDPVLVLVPSEFARTPRNLSAV